MTRIIHVFAILVAALLLIPQGVIAQDQFPRFEPEYSSDGPRGLIQVTNDWRDTVNVTMWTHRREQIGDSWEIEPGESAFLAVDEERIKVRPSYKIKVGFDWGWVNLGDVARFRRGVWYVNVRDIWRATHSRGDRGGRPNWEDQDVPDWRR